MFTIALSDVRRILEDFGLHIEPKSISELQRYNYDHHDPNAKEIRLIVKVELEAHAPLVLRFKNESDVTIQLVESQSCFADRMRKAGIMTPLQYRSNGAFAKWYHIGEYDVIVTVEQFVENEIRIVDETIAEKTGALLAKMHDISEKNDLHVCGGVMFDPFAANDLFDVEVFQSLGAFFDGNRALYDRILQTYHAYMEILSPLKAQPRYAVQGDISDCNMYQSPSGEIGIFDYNRCGDNNLFCDAVMQAVFEARLMDYPDELCGDAEATILPAFLRGYRSIRDFSEEQLNLYPYLYTIIDAFWRFDIRWSEDSLMNAVKSGNMERAQRWLETIWQRLDYPYKNKI